MFGPSGVSIGSNATVMGHVPSRTSKPARSRSSHRAKGRDTALWVIIRQWVSLVHNATAGTHRGILSGSRNRLAIDQIVRHQRLLLSLAQRSFTASQYALDQCGTGFQRARRHNAHGGCRGDRVIDFAITVRKSTKILTTARCPRGHDHRQLKCHGPHEHELIRPTLDRS